MRATQQLAVGLRQVLPVALCALGGHLALYQSLHPSSGDHAYLAWYEPAVLGLSLAGLFAFVMLVLAAALGAGRLREAVTRVLLPASQATPTTGVRAVRLALASLAFLVAQETVERTQEAGHLVPAAFAPVQVLIVLGAIVALAAIVAVLERSCSRLIALVIAATERLSLTRAAVIASPVPRRPHCRRRNALADLRGLRAPPVVS
jgi:hypothetical protein